MEIQRRASLDSVTVAEVRRISAAQAEADGIEPLSEHVLLHLGDDGDQPARHLLLRQGDSLVGYAHLDPSGTAELSVAPGDGAPDHARALLDALSEAAGERLEVWAHGEQSGLAELLREQGFRADRVLLKLCRSLADPLPPVTWPAGVTVRTFQSGRDEAAWRAVNNRAFAGHPEQSGWTVDEIRAREREPWFDPAGFFLAERAGEIVGFHWTKVHDSGGGDGGPIGEVYILGVDPAMHGQRLGSALTSHGLAYLRDRGLLDVMLYVDESNDAGLSLYTRLGFTRWDADLRFTRTG